MSGPWLGARRAGGLPAFHGICFVFALWEMMLMRRNIFSQYEISNITLQNEIRKPLILNNIKNVLYKTQDEI